jgi:hypothetical protein
MRSQPLKQPNNFQRVACVLSTLELLLRFTLLVSISCNSPSSGTRERGATGGRKGKGSKDLQFCDVISDDLLCCTFLIFSFFILSCSDGLRCVCEAAWLCAYFLRSNSFAVYLLRKCIAWRGCTDDSDEPWRESPPASGAVSRRSPASSSK